MIIRCRLERRLKEVNASNAAASGGCKALNRRLDCSAAEIRLRWRANANQPSLQSHGDGGGNRRILWWRVLRTAAGEGGILLERVDLSHTSKLPIAVHSAAEAVLNEATRMFADLEARAARNTFPFPPPPLTSLNLP
jgi:hypothetical protein